MRRPRTVLVSLMLVVSVALAQGAMEISSGAVTSGVSLVGLSCASSSFCVAVGATATTTGADAGTRSASWNGATWTFQHQASTGSPDSLLRAVSCPTTTLCVAAGARVNEPLTEKWTGSRWSVLSTPEVSTSSISYSPLFGISCVSSSFCVAVGGFSSGDEQGFDRGLIEMWNGTKWTVWNTKGFSQGALTGISCTSSAACTAVGYTGEFHVGTAPAAYRWNGVTWASQQVPTGAQEGETVFSQVTCPTATFCIAVGHKGKLLNPFPNEADSPLVETWNGGVWSIQSTLTSTGAARSELTGVSCTSTTSCQVVGTELTAGITFSEIWNGVTWTEQTMASPKKGTTLGSGANACFSAGSCLAIGTNAGAWPVESTYAQHWNGGTWSQPGSL